MFWSLVFTFELNTSYWDSIKTIIPIHRLMLWRTAQLLFVKYNYCRVSKPLESHVPCATSRRWRHSCVEFKSQLKAIVDVMSWEVLCRLAWPLIEYLHRGFRYFYIRFHTNKAFNIVSEIGCFLAHLYWNIAAQIYTVWPKVTTLIFFVRA